MASIPDNLSAKQHKAIECLLAASSISSAAKQAGVGERTLHRWLREDQDFDTAYRTARWRVVQHAIVRLQQTSGAAVTILLSIAADKHAPASSRVAAASKVLELSLKSVEIEELEARLTNLEQVMKEKGR